MNQWNTEIHFLSENTELAYYTHYFNEEFFTDYPRAVQIERKPTVIIRQIEDEKPKVFLSDNLFHYAGDNLILIIDKENLVHFRTARSTDQ